MNMLNRFAPVAHWLLRLSFAATFILHGLPKVFSPGGFAGFTGLPIAMAVIVGLFEVVGGILVLYGGFGPDWATRLGGLLTVPVMLGAISMVHLSNGWDNTQGGAEFNVLLIVVALLFAVQGNRLAKAA